jgi:hypothetical protein
MSLHVLAYKMKRMIGIMSIGPLLAAVRVRGEALTAILRRSMAIIRYIGRFLALIIVTAPKSAPA